MARVPGAVADASRVRGEETQVQSGKDRLGAYLALPATGAPKAGIIVIHEAFGLNDHIKDLARRFANLGYAALAPDLYSRVGAPDPTDMASLMAKMFGLTDAQIVADLDAASQHLRGLKSGGVGKVGCIGFCSGGRQTLLFACSSRAVDAAADCWGGFISAASPTERIMPQRPTPILDLVGNIACPVFAAFGDEDQNPPVADAKELEARAKTGGKDVTVKIYKNAGHAFLADYRPSYREAAAFELWDDVTAFFKRRLG
jgi:carboxymethylenebutenolidase